MKQPARRKDWMRDLNVGREREGGEAGGKGWDGLIVLLFVCVCVSGWSCTLSLRRLVLND
jgi:hypothetical protein